MATRLLVADDHQLMRHGLVSLLEGEGFEVVAQADNGQDAVRLAGELVPDVAILDITMPRLNGIEAARRISAGGAGKVKVIALSMHADTRFVTEMFQAGARGYILKMAAFEQLAEAIRTVVAGGEYVAPEIAGTVIRKMTDRLPGETGGLSEREREVLQLLAEGKSSKEIAFGLNISTKTVDTHRRQIMDKLGLRSLAELTKYAIRQGLTPLEE